MDSELSPPSSPSSSIGSDIESVPSLKSHWTLDHLENMGVVYADKTSTLTELMTCVKSSAEIKNDMKSIPRLCEVLMEFCRDLWTISYDFRNQSWMEAKEKITEVNALKANFKSKEKDMMKTVKKRLGVDNNRLFFAWCWHMLEFWQYFGDLLARFKKPCQRGKRFTYLFMAFSKMFFLRPEGGKAYRSYLGIKDVAVMGNPDIRYMMPRKEEIGEKLFIVTEAKNYDALRGHFSADTFSFKNISSDVLGQHGIELLIERKESHLFPGVLGIMCIGTQIIFTFLTVTNDQFDDILNGVGNKTQTSSIIYTRPYDYMDEADRNELMEPLFWLGYIQSLGYSIYGSAQSKSNMDSMIDGDNARSQPCTCTTQE